MSDEMTMDEVLAEAAGRQYGKNAAAWAIEPERMSVQTMRVMLKDIQDGDPITLDHFKEPNLSGENQDDPTPLTLAVEIGLDPNTDDLSLACEAWEEAAREAFWNEIERILIYHTTEEK